MKNPFRFPLKFEEFHTTVKEVVKKNLGGFSGWRYDSYHRSHWDLIGPLLLTLYQWTFLLDLDETVVFVLNLLRCVWRDFRRTLCVPRFLSCIYTRDLPDS